VENLCVPYIFKYSLHLRKAKNDTALVRTHQRQLVRLQQEANVALRVVRLAAQARHRPDVGDRLDVGWSRKWIFGLPVPIKS
jgi:hypothetical protein